MKKYLILLGLIFFILCFFLYFVSSLTISTNILEKYDEVVAGNQVYFQISLKYPENPQRKDVELVYEIRDERGKILTRAQVLRAIETQASFFDFLSIPDFAQEGIYTLEVKFFEYGKYIGRSSSTFYVIKQKENIFEKYFYILFIGILFISIVVTIDLFRKRRDK